MAPDRSLVRSRHLLVASRLKCISRRSLDTKCAISSMLNGGQYPQYLPSPMVVPPQPIYVPTVPTPHTVPSVFTGMRMPMTPAACTSCRPRSDFARRARQLGHYRDWHSYNFPCTVIRITSCLSLNASTTPEPPHRRARARSSFDNRRHADSTSAKRLRHLRRHPHGRRQHTHDDQR